MAAIDTSKLSPAAQKALAKLQNKVAVYKSVNADPAGKPYAVNLKDTTLESSFTAFAYLSRTTGLQPSAKQLVGMNLWQLQGSVPIPQSATGMDGGVVVLNAIGFDADFEPTPEDIETGAILAAAFREARDAKPA